MSFLTDPGATVEYEQIILERMKMYAMERISPALVASMDLRSWTDHITQSLVYTLSANVLADRVEQEEWKVEQIEYASWRDQLTASLPDGFRRRFLTYLWGEPDVKRIEHVVTVNDFATYPSNTRAMPPELGPPVFLRTIS